MDNKCAARKTSQAISSHGKPVADNSAFKAPGPASEHVTDEIQLADIFAKVLRSLSAEDQIKGMSVDPTYLVNYTTAVVLLAVEATSKHLSLRQKEEMRNEVDAERTSDSISTNRRILAHAHSRPQAAHRHSQPHPPTKRNFVPRSALQNASRRPA
jgi:hypothetical protein